ncbi:hypothetical protein NF212_06955 [Parasalinivibrio latis]|uniref:hypothetical protein n=1 Tax=Parasalinivibrio latis TaxID=2952610 RepID=UPI0030E582CB
MSTKREILSLPRGKKQSTANSELKVPVVKPEHREDTVVDSPVPVTQVEPIKEATPNVIGDAKPSKKTVKKTKNFTSLDELLLDVFKKELKTDGKLKPIKIDKVHESALKRMTGLEPSDKNTWESISTNVSEVDPTFKHLLSLLLSSASAKPALRRKLIEFAVLVISRNWVGKLSGSNNVFADLAGTVGVDNQDSVSLICRGIKDLFDKQIDNRKRVERSKDSKDDQQFLLGVSDIKNKKANVISICCLWASETGKADYEKTISQLKNFLLQETSSVEVDPVLTNYFFAGALRDNAPFVLAAIRFFQNTCAMAEERRKSAESELGSKEQRIFSLQNNLNSLKSELAAREEKIAQLMGEIESLKSESYQRELSEQATRVHLRDDAGQAKARANTLLSEDIAPAMELSLKALNRESPKVDVAIYQIELALENIEKGLPWFSK